jgi:hypothetical protein
MHVDKTSPPDLSGLWATYGLTKPADRKAPLLTLSDVPKNGADEWLHALRPPSLEALEIDMDTISCYVSALEMVFTSLQTDVTMESIEINKLQKKADFEKAQEEQRKAEAKAKEAKEAAGKAMIGEWIAAIAGVIGAVLATIGAFIMTGPLLGCVAVAGCLMAVQSLTNTALKQDSMNGNKHTVTDALGKEHQLSLSWGLAVEMAQAQTVADGGILREDGKGNVIDAKGKIMTKDEIKAAFEKNPAVRIMSEDQLGKERLAATLVVEIGIAVAMIGCGIKGMLNAGKAAADAVEKTTKSVRLGIEASQKHWERVGRWAEGITAATEVLGGAGDITSAGYAIHGANVQFESSNARAEQFFYEKKMKVALIAIQNLHAACKNLVQDLSATYEAMSQQIKDNSDLHVAIARRMVTASAN